MDVTDLVTNSKVFLLVFCFVLYEHPQASPNLKHPLITL